MRYHVLSNDPEYAQMWVALWAKLGVRTPGRRTTHWSYSGSVCGAPDRGWKHTFRGQGKAIAEVPATPGWTPPSHRRSDSLFVGLAPG